MLRNWRKKVQTERLGTPIRTKKGTYIVPALAYARADGEIRYEIDAKSIALAIIADDLGTDDPYTLLREYTRRQFIATVRRFCDTEEEANQASEAAGPLLPPLYHREGKIIPFPGNRPARPSILPPSETMPDSQSEGLGLANNVLASQEGITTTGNLAETATPPMEQIVSAPEKPLTEAERIVAAIEEVLKTASSEEERELYRQFLAEHDDLAHSAIDDHTRLSLCIHEGKVHAHYVRYTDRAVCRA